MKIVLSFLSSLSILIFLTGCPERQKLVNETGIYRSPKGTWKVELFNEAPGLRITQRERRPGGPSKKGASPKGKKDGKTIIPEGWVSSPGAFVYFDDQERVWAFDGQKRTYIVENSETGILTWNLGNYPGAVPPTFQQMMAGAQNQTR